MVLPINITLKGVIIMIFGVACVGLGLWIAIKPFASVLGMGFAFFGLGSIAFGATNGFSDSTPIGRRIYQFGMAAYVIGVPLLAFGLYSMV